MFFDFVECVLDELHPLHLLIGLQGNKVHGGSQDGDLRGRSYYVDVEFGLALFLAEGEGVLQYIDAFEVIDADLEGRHDFHTLRLESPPDL